MKRLLTAVVALIALAGCAQPGLRALEGDDAPEGFVGASRLRETFIERDGWLVSPILEAPALANRVAVWATTDVERPALVLEARATREDGSLAEWRSVEWKWSEGVQRVGRAELGTFIAAEVRIRADEADALSGLVYSAVVVDLRTAQSQDQQIDAFVSTTTRAISLPGVEPRSAWGARANGGCSANENKDWISVHHSVSALQAGGSLDDHAAAVRGIQAYHMDGRGYCDMGYHWAVTANGTAWEGREARFLGAHTGNHNTNNAGIVFIGCFHPSADCNGLGDLTPPPVMMQAGGNAIGAIAAHYGISISASTVIGHRDNPDQSTACPGDSLHDLLGELRTIAGGGGVDPPPPVTTGKVQGVVWDLSITTDASLSDDLSARIFGATVTVEGGASTTSRADDAYWSFDLDPGTYTITAAVDGFAPASREVQITAGAELWASIGVSPQATALQLVVHVRDSETGAPIENASVTVTGADPAQTELDGSVTFDVLQGDVAITATAEGYDSATINQVLSGASASVDVDLDPIVIPDEGEEPPPDILPQNDVDRVTILPPVQATGGCGCSNDPDDPGPLVVVLLSGFMLYVSARAFRRRGA